MQLYKHQQNLLNLNPKKHGLFFDMGTGKTLTVIELIKKNKTTALVIVPKGLRTQWEITLEEHKLSGKCFLMSKEEFRRDHKLLDWSESIIVDEAHFFSNYKSQMAKALGWYIKKHNPEFIWFLTGTPYLSTPFNIWTLARLLGHQWPYNAFRREFFHEIRMGHRMIYEPRKNKVSDLLELAGKIGTFVKMEDCIDFPPEVEEKEFVSLTSDQRKAITEIEANEILVLPKMTRIHQIIGGTLKENPVLKQKHFETDKLERTLSFISENRKSIIICRYTDELSFIKGEISKDIKSFIIDGSVNNRSDILCDFDNAEHATLLVNASCSEGWESKSCSAMLFYSMDWSVKNYTQMRARIRRINAPRKLYYKFLLCKNSIDTDVYTSVVVDKMDFYRKIVTV